MLWIWILALKFSTGVKLIKIKNKTSISHTFILIKMTFQFPPLLRFWRGKTKRQIPRMFTLLNPPNKEQQELGWILKSWTCVDGQIYTKECQKATLWTSGRRSSHRLSFPSISLFFISGKKISATNKLLSSIYLFNYFFKHVTTKLIKITHW